MIRHFRCVAKTVTAGSICQSSSPTLRILSERKRNITIDSVMMIIINHCDQVLPNDGNPSSFIRVIEMIVNDLMVIAEILRTPGLEMFAVLSSVVLSG
jgi:hypothetical protein